VSSDRFKRANAIRDGATTIRIDARGALDDEIVRAHRESLRPVVLVMSGQQMGLRRKVDQSLAIGRDPASGLPLVDRDVSWNHALIEDRGDAWAIVDLNSRHGTFVNDERVRDMVLRPHDSIVVGQTILHYEIHDAVEQAYDERVQRLLDIDELSGLFVRRRFDVDLLLQLDAARLGLRPLGILAMDLDGVKALNDAHGHRFGEHLIGEVGRVIGSVIGDRGFASRYGGDEFVAALPGHDLSRTLEVGEQLRAVVATSVFAFEGVPLQAGISIGAAVFPANGDDAGALLSHADGALYRAKRAGRNRVSR
jgi:two-component system cell cycle response regulator